MGGLFNGILNSRRVIFNHLIGQKSEFVATVPPPNKNLYCSSRSLQKVFRTNRFAISVFNQYPDVLHMSTLGVTKLTRVHSLIFINANRHRSTYHHPAPPTPFSETQHFRDIQAHFSRERTGSRYWMPSEKTRMAYVVSFLLLVSVLTSIANGLILPTGYNGDHLIVLTHGIMGTGEDLAYLGKLLEKNGCFVLKSVSNENFKSLGGFKTGGEKLASEIVDYVAKNKKLKRVSVVGNSLGGLYARYAMKILFNNTDDTIAGLKPYRFMSIATPHLGVRNHTFVEDYGLTAPDILKRVVSKVMLSTGRDIFGMKENSSNGDEDTLLFRMATEDSYLSPLRSFSDRRLYANLNRDFVVPLGTAAFMEDSLVQELRREHYGKSGIVSSMKIPVISSSHASNRQSSERETSADKMMRSLNGLGWDKVIVNFPGMLPIAHNKICALSREPKWLFNDILGFNAGEFVMKDACSWLSE